jgi:hypothetical protein
MYRTLTTAAIAFGATLATAGLALAQPAPGAYYGPAPYYNAAPNPYYAPQYAPAPQAGPYWSPPATYDGLHTSGGSSRAYPYSLKTN